MLRKERSKSMAKIPVWAVGVIGPILLIVLLVILDALDWHPLAFSLGLFLLIAVVLLLWVVSLRSND